MTAVPNYGKEIRDHILTPKPVRSKAHRSHYQAEYADLSNITFYLLACILSEKQSVLLNNCIL